MKRSYGGHAGDLDFSFWCEVGGGQCDGQGGEGSVEARGGGGDGVGVGVVGWDKLPIYKPAQICCRF